MSAALESPLPAGGLAGHPTLSFLCKPGPELRRSPASPPCSFHFRDACHKCGTNKPENAVELGLEYVGDGTQGQQQRPVERVPGSGLQPGQMARPGDWRCNMCNNVK